MTSCLAVIRLVLAWKLNITPQDAASPDGRAFQAVAPAIPSSD
jgi:hypothetical protein